MVEVSEGPVSAATAIAAGAALNMLLWCPKCHTQHVDDGDERTPGWTNPPHRSHLCHECGCIWRPADVPTNGVREIATVGKADNYNAFPKGASDFLATLQAERDRYRVALEWIVERDLTAYSAAAFEMANTARTALSDTPTVQS